MASNNCPFCAEDAIMNLPVNANWEKHWVTALISNVKSSNPEIIIDAGPDNIVILDITYCPFCGRYLKEVK